MKPGVLFRVDGSLAIGTGHVRRCLALAEALRNEGAPVLWVTRPQLGDLRQLIAAKGIDVCALSPVPPANPACADGPEYEHWLGVPWQVDADQTLRALSRRGFRPDVLIVDHYGIDARWERRVRPYVGRLVVVDDLGNRPHQCDLLIVPAEGRRPSLYRRLLPKECRILAGASYALIASEFAAGRIGSIGRRQARRGAVKRILIGFGGVDRSDLTSLSLRALRRVRFDGEVDVVLGAEAPHRETVAGLLKACFPNSRLHIAPPSMASLMTAADLSIGAAGVMSWERCTMGLPAVVVCAARNQVEVASALAARGAALVMEPTGALEASLAEQLGELLRNPVRVSEMGKRAAALCDGLGAARTALVLAPEKARDGKDVTLRLAQTSDSELLFRWQLHPSTRAHARKPEPPSYEAHCRWVRERIEDPLCLFHLVEYDTKAAGVLRLDALETPRAFEVSIHIAPELKQRGIARAALRGIRRLLPWAELHAWVMPGNTPSRRLFEGAGYVYHDGRYIQRPRTG